MDTIGNVYFGNTSENLRVWNIASNNVTTLLPLLGFSAIDTLGNFYFVGNSITEWSVVNSNLATLISGVGFASGAAVDAAGNVYDAYDTVVKWTVGTTNVTTLVSSGLTQATGIAVDIAGNLYISDGSGIHKWTVGTTNATGTTNTTMLVSSGLTSPNGIAVDGSGNVYISDSHALKKWTAANNTLITLNSLGQAVPYGKVALDALGNIYLADGQNCVISELPNAFVDPTAKLEGATAGSDVLPVVLPATENLLPPFAPTSSQSWLTITGITNGVVSFAFTANTGSSNRTANIALLGETISVTQTAPVLPPLLISMTMLDNGMFQFAFSNNNVSAFFTVLSTTNLSLPLTNWTAIGVPTNIAPGLFQFAMPASINDQQRFYRVSSP